MSITQKQLFEQVRALNLTIGCKYGEYRIAPKGLSKQRTEDCAYYTDDREDALNTARHMAQKAAVDAIDKRKDEFGALTVAALNMLDLQNLTDQQRYIADQIYELCNQLEYTAEMPPRK